MTRRIAVLGAGMAGLACANRLVATGNDVVVLDKGRTIGGRLATRESSGFSFDHGAPALQAERAPFQSFMRQLAGVGTAAAADDIGFPGRYIAVPAMNRLLSPISNGLDIRQNHEVIGLIQGDNGWTIGLKDREPLTGVEAVALTIPAPQAANLLATIAPEMADAVEAVTYRPVMTAMVALQSPLGRSEPVLTQCSAVIAAAIRNDIRPGRPNDAEQWVLHASDAWSRANVETERPDIANALFADFKRTLDRPDLEAAFIRGHRWRYALVEQPLGDPCLWDAGRRLGLAGDYCRGPNAEHAFESGIVLAERINA